MRGEHLYYQRHFILLGCGITMLAAISLLNLYGDAFFAFAINGALHASVLIASLRAADTLVRKCLFVAISAVLSIFALYVGIVALVLLAVLPDNARLPAVLAICAASGAVTYGSLVRIFWIRNLRPRSILAMAMVCMLVILPAYFAKIYFQLPGMWWLVAIWWLAFSCSLWLFDLKAARQGPVPSL
jgi:hypothetical protein